MLLPPLHLPLISAGFFGSVLARMLEFVALRIRRSDQGMRPSLSPDLRAQTVALHRRLVALGRDFERLAGLARAGRLRVYPDRASPAPRAEGGGAPERPAVAPAEASPFGNPVSVVQGPTLPAIPTRGFGWMLGFVPAENRDALARMLANPEMVALIKASPAVARVLRPLCRGLGVTPPDGLFPAPRRRGRRRSQRDPVVRAHRGGRPPGAGALRALGVVASPQARDRLWARTPRDACVAAMPAARTAGGGRPARGRCAKS